MDAGTLLFRSQATSLAQYVTTEFSQRCGVAAAEQQTVSTSMAGLRFVVLFSWEIINGYRI